MAPENLERKIMEPLTNIIVKLTGTDGNAFAVLGKVIKALKQAGHAELATQYTKEATKKHIDSYKEILDIDGIKKAWNFRGIWKKAMYELHKDKNDNDLFNRNMN